MSKRHFSKTLFICLTSITAVVNVENAVALSTNRADQVLPLIEFKDASLDSAILNLARQADLNVVYDHKTGFESSINRLKTGAKPLPNLTLSWTNLTAHQALTAILTHYGLHLVEIRGTTVSLITLTNLSAQAVDVAWTQRDTNSIPLIQMQAVPWIVALKNLARQANVSMTIEAGLERNTSSDTGQHASEVTIRWQHLTARQALAALCEAYDLFIEPVNSSNSINITSRRSGNLRPKPENNHIDTIISK